MIATLASIGLPGLAGFVGEFMILFGTFGSETLAHARLMAVLAATGVVLGAIYMLWMYQRVFFGKLANEKNKGLPDLSLREMVVLLPLVIFMFWLGVRPGLVLDKVEASIDHGAGAADRPRWIRSTETPTMHARHVEPDSRTTARSSSIRDTENQ